jgi:chromosome segregation ATPase
VKKKEKKPKKKGKKVREEREELRILKLGLLMMELQETEEKREESEEEREETEEERKSKRSADLLLAELNEVQDRNDVLQEELAKAANEVAELTKERDLAEAAKHEAISRLEKLSTVHSEERKNQLSELMGMNPVLNQLSKGFHDVNNLLADVFSKDLEFLHNLEVGVESFLKSNNAELVVLPLFSGSDGVIPRNSDNKVLFMLIYLF